MTSNGPIVNGRRWMYPSSQRLPHSSPNLYDTRVTLDDATLEIWRAAELRAVGGPT
jgi:hypothetical protein